MLQVQYSAVHRTLQCSTSHQTNGLQIASCITECFEVVRTWGRTSSGNEQLTEGVSDDPLLCQVEIVFNERIG